MGVSVSVENCMRTPCLFRPWRPKFQLHWISWVSDKPARPLREHSKLLKVHTACGKIADHSGKVLPSDILCFSEGWLRSLVEKMSRLAIPSLVGNGRAVGLRNIRPTWLMAIKPVRPSIASMLATVVRDPQKQRLPLRNGSLRPTACPGTCWNEI